ncbi:hypothetical protein SHLI107390_20185 [Shewanella livingstonensis]
MYPLAVVPHLDVIQEILLTCIVLVNKVKSASDEVRR